MTFNLAAPRMLWLLALVAPPLVLFFWWSWRKRQELITQFISARLVGTLKVGVSPVRQKVRMALVVAAVACLILALARPQWGYTLEEVRQRGLDIIVAIDTSNSMLAEDVPPNRLARAKLAALDLMRRARTDRLGLIAFAGNAFLTCPLTLDDDAFGQSVDSLDTHAVSQGGTALAEAIEAARSAFKDEADNHKVLILFTDGEDHDSDAAPAAERAAKEGMRIFTVGIGTPEGEILRVRDERGHVDTIKDENGNPVKSQLNEKLLKDIAAAAGGFYLPLRGTRTMDTLYEQGIAPLPKSTTTTRMLRQYREQYHWPLGLAMVLLLVEMFLPDRKRRRSKSSAAVAGGRGALAETVVMLLLLAVPPRASGGPSSGLRDYQDGKYQDALKEYEQALEKRQDDPRLHFNAGAAAYQSHQLPEAANQFSNALSAPDLELQQRAYYNLGNTYYRLGERSAGPPGAGGLPTPGADTAATQKAWEQALKQYESALKLNAKDEDAKYNHDFVQRQLEELKKQQQQQQSQNNSQNQQQQQNQKDQSQKDQSKQDQDKQQQQQQSKQDSQNQQQQDQPSQQKQQQDQAQNRSGQPDQQKQNDKDQGGQPKDQPRDEAKDEAAREAAMMAAGQMTPQQAKQLLDAQKGDDEVLRMAPPEKDSPPRSRSFKDW